MGVGRMLRLATACAFVHSAASSLLQLNSPRNHGSPVNAATTELPLLSSSTSVATALSHTAASKLQVLADQMDNCTKEHPFITNVAIAGAKGVAADLTAQSMCASALLSRLPASFLPA